MDLDEKKCLHCGKNKLGYCEECYQELIRKNAKMQVELAELKDYKERTEYTKKICKYKIEKAEKEVEKLQLEIENKIRKKLAEAEKEYNEIHVKHYRDSGISEARAEAKIEAYKELLNTKEEK